MSSFWRLACADPALVGACPSHVQGHFTLMGGGVAVIGVVTGLSGYYAAGLLFNQFHTTLIFGLVWGLMFTNLYRYMLVNVGFYDDLHKTRDGRSRPWGSVLFRAALISFFSFVMAQPVKLFLLRGAIKPRLEVAQARQRAQVLAELYSRFVTEGKEAQARVRELNAAKQLLLIDLQQIRGKIKGYETVVDWRLDKARNLARDREQEVLGLLADLDNQQAGERQALDQAAGRRQALVASQIARFDAQQAQAGTLLLQIQILHRELPWAGVLTVVIIILFLLPLLQRTFLQGLLSDYVRRNTWEETQVIKASYSQFKLSYAQAMLAATGKSIPWPDQFTDPRDWEKQQELEVEAFLQGTAGVATGRLANHLRAHATLSALPHVS